MAWVPGTPNDCHLSFLLWLGIVVDLGVVGIPTSSLSAWPSWSHSLAYWRMPRTFQRGLD
jgi:hypothetical protein